jgi:ferredoxin
MWTYQNAEYHKEQAITRRMSVARTLRRCWTSGRWNSTATTTTTTSSTTTINNTTTVQSYLQARLPESTDSVRRAIVTLLEPVYGRPLTVTHLQSFAGLLELAASISMEQQEDAAITSSSTAAARALFEIPLLIQRDVQYGGRPMELQWKNPVRTSLLQALRDDPMTEQLLEASCGGNASCCSCHVLLDQNLPSEQQCYTLSPIQETERDMLDYAAEYDETKSRLACQVRVILTHDLETTRQIAHATPLTITIPGTVNDLWN